LIGGINMAKKEEKSVEKVLNNEVDTEQSNGIEISEDVVEVIAGKAITETPGVYEMAGGFAGGISEVLSGKKNLSKGIKVQVDSKEAMIDVNIIVEYGSRIPDVAFDIQNRVKTAVESMTGLKVTTVNVHIQGVNTEPKKEEKEEKEEKKKKAPKKEEKENSKE
jgi:uncharacterized alkaline shock family protein YloU